METDTVADLSNVATLFNHPYLPHKLGNQAELVVIADLLPLQPALSEFIHDPYVKLLNAKPKSYIDVFIDVFWGLSQGPVHR